VRVVTNSGDMGEIERVGYLFEHYETKGLDGEPITVAEDPSGIVARILADDDGQSVRFNMMCGGNESSAAFSKGFVEQEVLRYLSEYDETDKWFRGIIGYSFSGQADFETYLAKRAEKPKRGKAKKPKKKTRSHRRRN
jgi:hypothetical protein